MSSCFSSDLALARRIEQLEAAGGLATVRSLQQHHPSINAQAEPFLGGYAVFGGVGSPMTHALGIGMNGPASPDQFDEMERFFRARGSAVLIDLCPLSHDSVQEFVRTRGYRIIEFNNVLVADPRRTLFEALPDDLAINAVPSSDLLPWSRTIMRGFAEGGPVSGEMAQTLAAGAHNLRAYQAEVDGIPAGGAGMNLHARAAAFIGDSTLPEARGKGIQQALIRRRLLDAQDAGCDLAVACVIPGSGSHRNYERLGFRLIYMRVNVMRE